MAKGDHKTNDIYLDSALWQHPNAILRKLLPAVSVSLETEGNDYVLVTDDDYIIMRFDQFGEFAKNLRRYGAIIYVRELFEAWENKGLYEEDQKGKFIRDTYEAFGEILEICDDFEMLPGEALK